jgi:glycosyltransferase involved in cell wall biosynthesis
MHDGVSDLRIAVISPFVDRRHGTERVLAEQLQRLSDTHGARVELYSNAVEGLDLTSARKEPGPGSGYIVWHRVPAIPGPHLFQYVWWFAANSVQRLVDHWLRKVTTEVTFSPGINAFDADVVAVHIVFHAFYDQVSKQLRLANAPLRSWARRVHRRVYYRCIMALENRIYRDPKVFLLPVSQLVAKQLRDYFGRTDVRVIPNGVAIEQFRPERRMARRTDAREKLGLGAEDFVLLLIGNDWLTKGLSSLLHAAALCALDNLRILVVGKDDPSLFDKQLKDLKLENAVRFLPPRDDVLFFYAAADAYVGPSQEDAFGLPILEAMACGLPVIASVSAGASEAIEDGTNGLLLRNPQDPAELAARIKEVGFNEHLRERLAAAAAATAKKYSWERNAAELHQALVAVAQDNVCPKQDRSQ